MIAFLLAIWTRFRPYLIHVGITAICVILAYFIGRGDGKREMEIALANANLRAKELQIRADENASDQRLADAISIATNEKGIKDAIDKSPAGTPDAARVAYGCERLRVSGRSEANLPEPCRRTSQR